MKNIRVNPIEPRWPGAAFRLEKDMTEERLTPEQLTELTKPLDPRMISKRKAGFSSVSYLEGHHAIDQANRIFGFGQWGTEIVSLDQVVLYDPLTGEAIGVEYRALVRISVAGCLPVMDVGSQPVTTWNVEDQVMSRREKAKKSLHEEITPEERRSARAVIVEAHEQAKKGAVTDAIKRAFRLFGSQFANGLYGDGPIALAPVSPLIPSLEQLMKLAEKRYPGQWDALYTVLVKQGFSLEAHTWSEMQRKQAYEVIKSTKQMKSA